MQNAMRLVFPRLRRDAANYIKYVVRVIMRPGTTYSLKVLLKEIIAE
jgi:hypothetical protein